jgi:hypothetical protein
MAAQKGIGRLVQFGIGKETSRGTPNAAADFYIPFTELDINEKINLINDEQSRGIIEDSVGASITKQWAEGQWKAPIGDKHFPLVLFSILGSKAVSGPVDSAYTHTITVGQSAQHPALSLFIDDPLGAQDYSHGNGMLTQVQINYQLAQFLSYSASFKAKKGGTATLTPAATAENRFLPQHLTFKLASAYSGLSAASAQVIKSLQLTITQNLEDDDVLGSVTPADFLNKQFTIEGTVEALWQNESDFKTQFLAGTAKAMRIDLISDVLIGATATPQLQINLAKCIFKELTRPVRINDMVKQTLSFKAHYSTTDSLLVSVTAKNLQATY